MLALLLCCAGLARGDTADQSFARGKQLFDQGQYAAAITEFVEAYRQEQAPEILPNIGTAHLRLRHPREALAYYELYLKTAQKVAPEQQRKVEGYMQDARDLLRQQEEAERAERDRAAAEARARELQAQKDRARLMQAEAERQRLAQQLAEAQKPRPIYKRWWFWGALGAVVVGGVAAGLGVYLSDPLYGYNTQHLGLRQPAAR